MLNVGVVGTGFGQKIHVPGFQALTGVQVLGLWGRDLAKTQSLAVKLGVPLVFESVEAMAQHPEIHAVSLTTPPHLHYEQAMTVLQAKKALLCEKPVALTAAQVQAMLTLAEANQLTHGVDFEFRLVPEWLRLKELLAADILGSLRLIDVTWQVEGRADASRSWNWYAQRDQGGGALGAIGSHAFDYIEWLFAPIATLQAQLTTTISQRPDGTGQLLAVDSDDTCNLLFTLASGISGLMSLSTVTWSGQGHWLRVYGEKGTLILGSADLTDYVHGFQLWFAPPGGTLQLEVIPERLRFARTYTDGRLAPFVGIAQRFVEAIATAQPMTPSLHEGLRSQQLIDAAQYSHQHSCVIKMSDFV